MIIPPLEFEPRLLHTLWGGKRLYGLKGIPAKNLTIGESWEVSPMAEIPSIVRGGELSGISLPQVMQRFGQEIMGEALCEKYGKSFLFSSSLLMLQRIFRCRCTQEKWKRGGG